MDVLPGVDGRVSLVFGDIGTEALSEPVVETTSEPGVVADTADCDKLDNVVDKADNVVNKVDNVVQSRLLTWEDFDAYLEDYF